jgi:hypothetical protein
VLDTNWTGWRSSSISMSNSGKYDTVAEINKGHWIQIWKCCLIFTLIRNMNILVIQYIGISFLSFFFTYKMGVRSSTMLQAGRSRVRFPMRSLGFFDLPNPSSHTMALGSTRLLTEISTGNLPGGKGRPMRKGWQPHPHLWASCLEKMWEPRSLTIQWAFMACYRDSFF